MSERPHRCRTWAPKGRTPVLQYHFNWKTLSAMAGVTWWNFYFRLFPGAIRAPQIILFLAHLLRHIRVKLFSATKHRANKCDGTNQTETIHFSGLRSATNAIAVAGEGEVTRLSRCEWPGGHSGFMIAISSKCLGPSTKFVVGTDYVVAYGSPSGSSSAVERQLPKLDVAGS
ncbi:MAG: hypothetical protein ACE14M_11745, partial [Terriglobales bacterium]